MTYLHGRTNRRWAVIAMALVIAISFSGCATAPKDNLEAMTAFVETPDPYEPVNRGIFEFNLVLDKVILRPIAFVYKEVVPDMVRGFIQNFMNNLRSPVIFANDLLQGETERAGDTLVRFMMNSTIGVVGIFDFAGELGIEGHKEDFGQTLAVWGLDSGPYLMLPILGPSSPRQVTGRLVDFLFDPLTFVGQPEWGVGRYAMRSVDDRAEHYNAIDALERTSLDLYAAVRSMHRQLRGDEIRNGAPPVQHSLPMTSAIPLNIRADPLIQAKLSRVY